MHADVLVAVGPAVTEGLIELSALRVMLPHGSAVTRIERLEPAVGRSVEDQSPCCDQGVRRDRQRFRHAPDHALLAGIPGTQLVRSRWLLEGELQVNTLIEKTLHTQIRTRQ